MTLSPLFRVVLSLIGCAALSCMGGEEDDIAEVPLDNCQNQGLLPYERRQACEALYNDTCRPVREELEGHPGCGVADDPSLALNTSVDLYIPPEVDELARSVREDRCRFHCFWDVPVRVGNVKLASACPAVEIDTEAGQITAARSDLDIILVDQVNDCRLSDEWGIIPESK